MIRIAPLNHRDAALALQIHVVRQLAYAQEAQLLGVSFFPPLERSVEEIQACSASYLGAFFEDRLVGVISSEPDEELEQVLIASLVVHPEFQRKGIARALLVEALGRHPHSVFAVGTAEANLPALTLYHSLGFTEYRRETVGLEELPLVKLRLAI